MGKVITFSILLQVFIIFIEVFSMDTKTIEAYNLKSDYFSDKYYYAVSGISKYFSRAFTIDSKILDVGCGIGKDLKLLISKGYDAFGIEPSEKFVFLGSRIYPEIKGRVLVDYLPDLSRINETFDGILCSAVLMHIPANQLFDTAISIKNHLRPGGSILFSIPKLYPGLDPITFRDSFGRLYNGVTLNQLALLFERLGFRLLETWEDNSEGAEGEPVVWQTALLRFDSKDFIRPLDTIESVLNRDQKVATYKLALFRAFAEIAMTNSKAVKWNSSGDVYLPVDLVIDKWIDYYWPIFESEIFIPQIQKEYPDYSRPVAFRKSLMNLINQYKSSGGYEGFRIDRVKLGNSPENFINYGMLRTQMKKTIINGPVRHAGGINTKTNLFGYDHKGNIIIPDTIWKELSLLGSWIIDASILRWAELSSKFSKGKLKPSLIFDLLIIEEKTRQIEDAKRIYLKHKNEIRCTWTSRNVQNFEIDHIIPFSLWKNNDLWNLVPSSPQINRAKSDKIVTMSLVEKAKDNIINDWKLLFKHEETRFLNEAKILIGNYLKKSNWENSLFAGLKEAIECTATQRGIERWEP